MTKCLLIVCVVVLGALSHTSAQPETTPEADDGIEGLIQADFDTSDFRPLVGEPFELTFTVETPPDVVVIEWPEFMREWGDLTLVEIGELQSEERPDGSTAYRQVFDARLWRPGDQQTPETFITYQVMPEDEVRRVPVRPVFFEVPSVLESSDLNTLQLRPDEPPIGFFYIPPLLALAIAAGAGAGGWFGWRWYQRRRTALAARNQEPEQTAQEIALNAILRLRDADLPHSNIYAEVAWRLREYLTAQYGVNAGDMTTAELMKALEGQVSAERLVMLRQLLERSDLVKFAQFSPDEQTTRQQVGSAYRWVVEDAP